MRYIVEVYMGSGRYSETSAKDFQECVSIAFAVSSEYPDKHVHAFNLDKVDLGYNGLTDEERTALAHAISDGRKSAGK